MNQKQLNQGANIHFKKLNTTCQKKQISTLLMQVKQNPISQN